jgi:hypothetical protein
MGIRDGEWNMTNYRRVQEKERKTIKRNKQEKRMQEKLRDSQIILVGKHRGQDCRSKTELTDSGENRPLKCD